ncbi:MAG TPA: subclass B3 metallo-beta-lactamase [Chthoniobacterales bacterium]|nr:subclass B3 metallo-beta-lactamase [Chthoniobacterales bacterium]
MKYSYLLIASLVLNSIAFGQADEKSRAMNKPIPPFRIAGNLYYVGANEISSFLITTPKGHILLDGGFVKTAPQIERNIAQLGFKIEEVKILLNSHAHLDHAGGLAELKKKSGAKLIASSGDAEPLRRGGRNDFRFGDTLIFPPVEVDQIIADGESVRLGDQIMTAHLTPGHTRGNTTWTTKISDNGKTYDVVFAGSPTALDYQLVGKESYPGITADFEKTFSVLKKLPCDIFLSDHGTFYWFLEKREKLLRGENPNPFIDPDGYRRFINHFEKEFHDKLDAQRRAAALSTRAPE